LASTISANAALLTLLMFPKLLLQLVYLLGQSGGYPTRIILEHV
jgi:hypothetical protein